MLLDTVIPKNTTEIAVSGGSGGPVVVKLGGKAVKTGFCGENWLVSIDYTATEHILWRAFHLYTICCYTCSTSCPVLPLGGSRRGQVIGPAEPCIIPPTVEARSTMILDFTLGPGLVSAKPSSGG